MDNRMGNCGCCVVASHVNCDLREKGRCEVTGDPLKDAVMEAARALVAADPKKTRVKHVNDDGVIFERYEVEQCIGKLCDALAAYDRTSLVRVSCNRHVECRTKRPGDPCCHSEDCEDCFGK